MCIIIGDICISHCLIPLDPCTDAQYLVTIRISIRNLKSNFVYHHWGYMYQPLSYPFRSMHRCTVYLVTIRISIRNIKSSCCCSKRSYSTFKLCLSVRTLYMDISIKDSNFRIIVQNVCASIQDVSFLTFLD